MVLFESTSAICPFCKRDGAQGSVWIKKSPIPDETNAELLFIIIYCMHKKCRREVGFGCKIVDGNVASLDADKYLAAALEEKK